MNFPNSPLGGDTFTVGDKTWVYSGGKWVTQAVAGGVAGDIALGTGTTGSYVSTLVAGTGITLTNNSGESATPTVAVNTSTIQARVANVTDTEIGYLDGVTSAIQTQIDTKAPLASPTFTGTVTIPSGASISGFAPLASPTFTGTPTLPTGTIATTQTAGNNTTAIATTAFVSTAVGSATINSLDAIADVTITSATTDQFLKWNGTVWVNDAINLGTDTTGSYVTSLVAGTGVTLANNSGESATPTVTVDTTVIAPLASPTFTGTVTTNDLTVSGNLTVSGTTTSINTETLTIDDNTIVLNNNATGAPSQDAGIEVERGSSTNVQLRWNETTDKWEFTNDGSVYTALGGSVAISDTAPSSPVQGAVWFESDTLKTFVYYDSSWVEIGVTAGVAVLNDLTDVTAPSPSSGQFLKWNGTAWVPDSIPTINALDDVGNVTAPSPSNGDFLKWNGSAWVNDAIDLGTDTTGNYVSDVTASTGITVTHTPGEGSSATVALNATLDDLSNVSVASPSSGQFLKWNGTAWVPATIIGGATISDTAPASPAAGQLWFDSTVGKTFVYYDSQWIEVGGVGTGARMVSSSSAPASPLEGSMWFDTDTAQTFVYYDSSWIEIGASGITASVQDSAPASPVSGQIWFNSLTGGTYVYYGTNWIEVGASPFSALINTINAKGDLLVGTADNTIGGLAVGSANQVLTVDSSTATGLKWATPVSTGKAIAMSIVFSG